MFNSENKTHYKMYKAGKRWMFGAITVTMFTAGIAGGTFLSNGKSVHADTAVSTTQNQNSNSSSNTDAADKTQDSNVQANENKTTPVASQTSEATQAVSSNNNVDQKKTDNNQTTTDQKSDNSTATQITNDSASQNNDSKAATQSKSATSTTDQQQADTATVQKDDNNSIAQNKAANTDQSKSTDDNQKNIDNSADQSKAADNQQQTDTTSTTQKADENSVDQNKKIDDTATDQNVDNKNTDQAVESDKTAENNQKTDDQTQNAADNQIAPENDAQKATEDTNQSQAQAAETNLASSNQLNVQPFSVDFTDPDYKAAGLPWVDPDDKHFTFGYYTTTQLTPNLPYTPSKVKNIVLSTDRNGDGTVYYYELDDNNNIIQTVVLDKNGEVVNSNNITGLQYHKFDDNDIGMFYADPTAENNGAVDNIGFNSQWFYDNPEGIKNTALIGNSVFIPELVDQKITWTNQDTGQVMYTATYQGMAGQHYDVEGIPPEISDDTYYISLRPTNASGTVSNFGKAGTKWTKHYTSGTMVYTETDDKGGMDVQVFDNDGNLRPSSIYDANGQVIGDGPSTVHIDADYNYNSQTHIYEYYWPGTSDVLGGHIILAPIYIPQSRNIDFEVGKLGKLVPVDKNTGQPIDNGSHDEPYKINPTDPTKAQQPTIPDIPGYTPVDPNDPSKKLKPGDPSPVPVTDPGKDTDIPYVKNTKTITQTGDGSITIHYQYADGQPVSKDINGNPVSDVKDTVTYHRTVEVDDNGNVLNPDTPWIADDGQNPDISANSPVVTGYYADQKTVTGQVTEGNHETKVVIYNKLGNLIPEVPGGTPVPYPNDPDDPTKAGEPITPNYPGYTPLDPNGNPIKPGTPYPINPNDPGKDTPVPYVSDNEKATVNYVDQDDNDSLLHTDSLDGKLGTKSDYSTKDEIAALEKQGYDLVTDGYPADGYTYTNEDPTFTVVLKHKTKTVTPDNPGTPGQPVDPDNPTGPKYPDGTGEQDVLKDITRTIHYKYADGTEASKDVTEQVKYTRTVTFDEVTGKIISSTDWSSQNPDYAEVTSPVIPGFVADQPVVGTATTKETDENSEVTVYYNPAAEKATVNYVDQDENDAVLHSDPLDGKFGEKADYSTKDEIAALEKQGYELVTDGYPADGYTYTTEDPTFTVVLKHKTKSVTPDNPGTPGQPVDPNNPDGPKYPDGTGEQDLVKNITRTIHYQYADGTEASKDVTEQVKYTREITFDEVTGKIIETGKWTSTDPNYASVDSPAIAGFTPDQAVVGQAATTADDSNSNVTVTYNANAEQAHVNYVDQDNNDSVIKSDTLDGKFGEKSTYSTKDEITALEAQGYELVTDGYPGDYTFTTEDPTFTVVLKHKTKTVTPDTPGTPGQPVDPNNPDGPKYPDGTSEKDLVKEITRTIHYKDDQGNTVAKDVVETTKFTHDVTFDEVTGKIIDNGKWVAVNDTFGAVNSPVINGYYTDTPEVSAETVNADASNSEVTVLYHALGHLVPDVPGSTPVIYPNNPDNPSEAGNPLIPDIPGYTPVDKNGNKLTPGTPYPIDHDHLGEDTPIHYVKNEEPATPVTPSTPETPAQPAAPAPEAPKAAAPQAPVQAETPAPAAKPAEAPKKAALPQTGQDATGNLMSIIGAILLSILGFFGLGGFRKRKEDK